MSQCAWQLLLIILGAVLELGGIGLVVWEVRDARRQAQAVMQRDQIIRPLGIAHERSIARGGKVIGGKQPTIDERVGRLEQQVPELREEMETRIHRVTETVRSDLGGLVAALRPMRASGIRSCASSSLTSWARASGGASEARSCSPLVCCCRRWPI